MTILAKGNPRTDCIGRGYIKRKGGLRRKTCKDITDFEKATKKKMRCHMKVIFLG